LHRFLSCLLILVLTLGLAAPAMGEQTPVVYEMAGFDGDNVGHDWNTNLFFQRMSERTGVEFFFDQHTDYDEWTRAKAQMIDEGTMPHVLFKAELTADEINAFDAKGMLLDLAPLIEQHAPNVYGYIQSDPQVRQAVVRPDGRILTLPSINQLPNNNVIWVNGEWLQSLKMEMPTDADSFRGMLEAFKTKDPNANGKQDEIPMTFLGVWDLKFLGHAFGLIANDYNVFADQQGNVQHLALQPQFRGFVEWLRALYADGLLDQRGFTTMDTMRMISDEKKPTPYGVVMGPTPMNLLPYVDAAVYQAMPPLWWEGEQVYRDLTGVVYAGAFALSSQCPQPERMLQWIDFLYTEEGGRLALAGEMGVDYEVDPEDGVWEWIGDLATKGQQIVREVSISESGNLPWRYPVEFQMKYGDMETVAILEQLSLLRSCAKLPFPPVQLEKEASQRINELQSILGLYMDTQLSRFIIGEIPLNDETWKDFIDTLYAQGLEEFMTLWQNALSH